MAVLFQDVANKWNTLSNAALPDSTRLFKDARLAALKWNDIFITKGQSAPRQLEQATEKIRSIQRQVIEAFPLSETEMLAFLEGLSPRLYEIFEGEKAALIALKTAVP